MDLEEELDSVPLTYDIVTSEIHAVRKPEKINGELGTVLSRFELYYPPTFTARNGVSANCHATRMDDTTFVMQADEDGDLLVPRRKGVCSKEVVLIEHQQSTSLSLVGEQVWRGALFLADFLLHSASVRHKINPNQFGSLNSLSSINAKISLPVCNGNDAMLSSPNGPLPSAVEVTPTAELTELDYSVPPEEVLCHLVDVTGKHVLEVASGVGLTSIVAALLAESILVTDINRGNILRLIERNLEHNRLLIGGCKVTVGELDFCNLDTIEALINDGRLQDIDVILAADVVYNNDLTDAFFDAAHRLLSEPPNKTLLVALEKRYVFTTTEYDVVAPCYDYFLHCLDRLKEETELHPRASQRSVPRSSDSEKVSSKSMSVCRRTEASTPVACTQLNVSENSDYLACNGPSSLISSDSSKVLLNEPVPCSVNESPNQAAITEASHSGLEADHDVSQLDAVGELDPTIGLLKSPVTEISFSQFPARSEVNGHGSKNDMTVYQRIKYSLKKLQYDNFPQYFAYDRTKELVLWKIVAEIS